MISQGVSRSPIKIVPIIPGYPRMSPRQQYIPYRSQVRVVPRRLYFSQIPGPNCPNYPPGCPQDISIPYRSQVRVVPVILGTSWGIPWYPKASVLLIDPRSELSQLSLGYPRMSPRHQYSLQIPDPSGPWSIPWYPKTSVLLTDPRSELSQISLGYPRVS